VHDAFVSDIAHEVAFAFRCLSVWTLNQMPAEVTARRDACWAWTRDVLDVTDEELTLLLDMVNLDTDHVGMTLPQAYRALRLVSGSA